MSKRQSTPNWTTEEREAARILVSNGWGEDEALEEARRALQDAAEEDGYDGP